MLMMKADFLFWTLLFWVAEWATWRFVNEAQQGFSKWLFHVREMLNKQNGLGCPSVRKSY